MSKLQSVVIFLRCTFFLLGMLPLVATGQQKKGGCRFESYTAVGWLTGDQTVHGLAQSVNGVSRGPWFVGLGAGLDEYRVRTVPVFLDMRYRHGKRKNKFFAYADIGYHVATDHVTGLDNFYALERNFDGGLYYDAGLGYQVPLTRKGWGLFFATGFSQKFMSESSLNYYFCPGILPCEPQLETAAYRFSRFSFKVGWKF